MIQYAINDYVYNPYDFDDIGFGALYSRYLRGELMFYGINIKGYPRLWAPIKYSKELKAEIPQIFVDRHMFTEAEFYTPEVFSVFGLWVDIQSLLSEIIVYINNKSGKYDLLLENQFNHEVCQKCGGSCCKNSGCYFSPKDFIKSQLSFEFLYRELQKGYISIALVDTRYTGLTPIFILKVRNVNDGVIVAKLKDGRCVLHSKNGCLLTDGKRPYGGRTLIPVKDGNCIGIYTFRQAAEDWWPYQSLLYSLVKALNGVNIPFKGLY